MSTLADDYAYATECQLATLEGLRLRKNTGRGELKRQHSICESMLSVCLRERDSLVFVLSSGGDTRHRGMVRVQSIMNAYLSHPAGGVAGALAAYLRMGEP
jgi:hypothetical protein